MKLMAIMIAMVGLLTLTGYAWACPPASAPSDDNSAVSAGQTAAAGQVVLADEEEAVPTDEATTAPDDEGNGTPWGSICPPQPDTTDE